jgi:hypothetical protein
MKKQRLAALTESREVEEPKARLDSALLHDAFCALWLGKQEHWTAWNHQCLMDATHLLLFDNVGIVAGPGHSRGRPVPGDEADLVKDLPKLLQPPQELGAKGKLNRWLGHTGKPLHKAWEKTLREPELEQWRELRRKMFWDRHIRVNDGLFNKEHLSAIAATLNVSMRDLQDAHRLSTNPKVVARWAKGDDGDVIQLADDAYLISSLIRGKYHEYVARELRMQLAAHPHREVIGTQVGTKTKLPASNTSQYFERILIGSALSERSKRRVPTWRDNLLKARHALTDQKKFSLPELPQSQAESNAVMIARQLGIECSPRWQRILLSSLLSTNASIYSGLIVGSWVASAPVALALGGAALVYKGIRHRSPVEDVVLHLTTDSAFHGLARTVPGRIERHLTSN